MEKNLIDKIKNLCRKSYPLHNWKGHLIPVVNAALRLQREYGGDREIIEAGAYLHDIGRVKFDFLKLIGIRHELSGYLYSKYKLFRYRCQEEKIERICKCVLSHAGQGVSRFLPKTLEEEIVLNADALGQFDEYLYLFAVHYHHKRSFEKTKKWFLEKLQRNLNTKLTLPRLKEKIEKDYERIKQEVKDKNEFLQRIRKEYIDAGFFD